MYQITEDDMQKLYDEFETTRLLDSAKRIDYMRGCFEQGDRGEPAEIRDNIFKLHELAIAVCNSGQKNKVMDMADLASDIQSQINEMIEALESVKKTVDDLLEACPDHLYD